MTRFAFPLIVLVSLFVSSACAVSIPSASELKLLYGPRFLFPRWTTLATTAASGTTEHVDAAQEPTQPEQTTTTSAETTSVASPTATTYETVLPSQVPTATIAPTATPTSAGTPDSIDAAQETQPEPTSTTTTATTTETTSPTESMSPSQAELTPTPTPAPAVAADSTKSKNANENSVATPYGRGYGRWFGGRAHAAVAAPYIYAPKKVKIVQDLRHVNVGPMRGSFVFYGRSH